MSTQQLQALGLKHCGKNVLISEKASIYDPGKISIGDYSRIDDFCVLSGKLTIGRNVHIAVFSLVAGGEEGVVLDDFSGLAYGAYAFSQTDDYTGGTMTNPTVPDKYKKETKKLVRIGRHCIIGAKSVVSPGVVMAEGSSLGAMSMLTKETEPWTVYFGIPARKLRLRNRGVLTLESQYLSECE